MLTLRLIGHARQAIRFKLLADLTLRYASTWPPKSPPEELSYKRLQYMDGICKIFMQGPLREDLTRISTRSSHKDLYKTLAKIFIFSCKIRSSNNIPENSQDHFARI